MLGVWVKRFVLVALSLSLVFVYNPVKSSAKTSSFGYFKVIQDNVTVYDNSGGKLIPVGSLIKGQVYQRTKDVGNWYQIQFGKSYGYVWEQATSSVSSNLPKDVIKSAKVSGTIKLRADSMVYAAGKIPLAVLKKDRKYPIIGEDSNWWYVLLGNRRGYVYKSDLTVKDFSSNDRFFKVISNNVTVYEKSSGKLVPFGTLDNGKIYSRVRDLGNWHQIIYAGKTGYVWKEATIPVNLHGAPMVPIITYHNFTTSLSNGENISPQRFTEHMKYLKARGYTTITFAQFVNFINGTGQLPKKALMITMDDSYLSQYNVAYPVLKSLGMKATIFTIVDSVGKARGSLKEFSWDQAREMERSGVIDIESHTLSSHWYVNGKPALAYPYPGETTVQYNQRILNDLTLSKTILDQQLNKQTIGLAYPFGKWNEAAKQAAVKAGLKVVFLYNEGTGKAFRGMDPLLIDRYGVNGNQTGADVVRMISK